MLIKRKFRNKEIKRKRERRRKRRKRKKGNV